MRTAMILIVGMLLLVAAVIFGRLFVQYYPSAMTWAIGIFLTLWLVATGFNLWIGVNKAGYSFGEELPIMLLLFLVPALLAVIVRWKIT